MFVLPSEKPIEFVPSVCKDDKKPLTFLIKPPTKSLILQVQSSLAESSINTSSTGNNLNKVMNLCLDECIVGWKNCVDENNKPVEFTRYFNGIVFKNSRKSLWY